MNQLQPIEYQGQRVLTTSQLAESYGTTADKISYNFNYNETRYQSGKHYFLLTGDELRRFKEANREFQGSLNKLYLWTEKGAWLHAKSLSTDRAWEAYDMLVDDYYRVKEASINLTGLSPQLQLLIAMEHRQLQIEQRQEQQQHQLTTIKETFLQRDDNWRQKINGLLNGAARRSGMDHKEVRNLSYQSLKDRTNCKLETRLENLRNRLADSGATKTRIADANKLDVIESDKMLKEIYTIIVKELSIGTLV
ncbi:ORF6N domain-containing protein [Virgibacillus sp. LDC1]|nr:ORF6N domain-containing protein [Virgibacillus sp. LDC1]